MAWIRAGMSCVVLLIAAALVMPKGVGQTNVPPPPPPDQQAQAYAPAAPVVFEDRIAPDQLAFLSQFARVPSGKLMRDKQFRQVMRRVIPNCEFHYGRDMSLSDAIDMVIDGSKIPVRIRGGRYVMVRGHNGPYLRGEGFLWIDMQEGVGLGGFFFTPTNGEPTPTVAAFSKQVMTKDKSIGMRQLPPVFAQDLAEWSRDYRVPFLTTRYFLTGSKLRILLEHDEDYCVPAGTPPGAPLPPRSDACEQINADAADIDLTAAYYLQQVHYATNATAWMIGSTDLVAWIGIRNNACLVGPHPLACRVRMTRQHTGMIWSGAKRVGPVDHGAVPPHVSKMTVARRSGRSSWLTYDITCRVVPIGAGPCYSLFPPRFS